MKTKILLASSLMLVTIITSVYAAYTTNISLRTKDIEVAEFITRTSSSLQGAYIKESGDQLSESVQSLGTFNVQNSSENGVSQVKQSYTVKVTFDKKIPENSKLSITDLESHIEYELTRDSDLEYSCSREDFKFDSNSAQERNFELKISLDDFQGAVLDTYNAEITVLVEQEVE